MKNYTIRTKDEFKSKYRELINNKNMHVDISTDILFDTTKVLPESVTLSENEDIIEDIYFNDKTRHEDYCNIIEYAKNNALHKNNITTAFHYGVSNDNIKSADIINTIENKDKDYFMTIFAYDDKNARKQYDIFGNGYLL